MAQRVLTRQVTVPAGTPSSAPVAVDLSFSQGSVTEVHIVIPDGHAGFTGIALAQANQQVIPEDTNSWIIGNNEPVYLPLSDYLNNGNWQAVMYNTDVYDHAFHLRFLVDDVAAPAAVSSFATGAVIPVGDALPAPEGDSGVAPILAGTPRPVGV